MSERKYNNTLPPMDDELKLRDAGLVTSTAPCQVDSAERVIDFGNDAFRSGGSGADGQAPYVKGTVVIIPTAIENGDGNETFGVCLQLSDTEDFSGIVRNRAMIVLGQQLVTEDSPEDVTALERYTMHFDNEFGGRTYRYARLVDHVAGTVGTGVNYQAWMTKDVG